MFSADSFEERAAIMEFCGGMSRFQAETMAAKAQGVSRWEALQLVKEAFGEDGARNSIQGKDNDQTMAGKQCSSDLPTMQLQQKEKI